MTVVLCSSGCHITDLVMRRSTKRCRSLNEIVEHDMRVKANWEELTEAGKNGDGPVSLR